MWFERRPSDLMGPPDRERIDAAVRRAEQGTSGEIVVALVRACEPWREAAWRSAALCAAIALGALALVPGPWPIPTVFALQAVAGTAGFALAQIPVVRRAFLTDAALTAAAERHAAELFAEHGLHRTAGRTGVLLFVALFEHRVVVLADEAVNQALDPEESWQAVVETVLVGIRGGNTVEGLLNAIRACGTILSRPLAASDHNPDEITRTLVLED